MAYHLSEPRPWWPNNFRHKGAFRSTTVITSSNMVGVDNNGHVPATVVTGRGGM